MNCHRHVGPRGPGCPRVAVSDLRIVLLGKSSSENIRVMKSILGVDLRQSEAPSEYLHNHSVKVSGPVENRHITVINSVNLLQHNLSYHQITERMKECISLCSPGSHVFILVLQHHNFSQDDRNRVKRVLREFSEEAMKHTIVLTTDEEIYRTKQPSLVMNEEINNLIQKCGGGHLQFDEGQAAWLSEMFRRIDEIVEKEPDEYLICETYEDAEGSSVNREPKEEDSYFDDGRSEESHKTRSDDGTISFQVFLIIVPVGPLTDEDKEEIEKIQKIFDSTDHFMMIYMSDVTVDRNVTDFVKSDDKSHRLIRLGGGRYRVIGLKEKSKQIPDLLEYIENMKTEPYSLQMFVRAQEMRVRRETEENYEEKLKTMETKKLQQKIQPEEMEKKHEDEARKQAEEFNEFRERKETWERRKQREDDERREEERTRWEKKSDDISKEKEEEIKWRETQERKRKEREEKEREDMMGEHEQRIKEMKSKHEDEARKQAEEFNEFRERKEQHVEDLKEKLEEHQKQLELLEKLHQHFKQQKGEETEELRKEVEELRNKSICVIL
ncbi:hypothetical protein E1301_Tti020418 [Triplophysa tibetana]|uniref:AIG1-type G domain-containing protein n=1 Tax=Triplophysa tibetana TaxID=1572043 RepID=A0A5A9NC27_9TELE|nr:hypothetical protein E1301_Tti020418 [Triplophysa tibetana]